MKDIGDMSSKPPYLSVYTFVSYGTDASDKILDHILKNTCMTLKFMNLITLIRTTEIIIQ
jgi:hypothetical protein